MRLSLPTVLGIVAVVGAAAFAAGQSSSSSSSAPNVVPEPAPAPRQPAAGPIGESDELPMGHPSTGAAAPGAVGATGAGGGAPEELPPGHPPVGGAMDPGAAQAAGIDLGTAEPSSLEWKAPARWQLMPNASSMRLATYRVPRAAGDTEDAELTITQAGGSAEANADRWVGQFDPAGQKTAKRSTRKVAGFDVMLVEVTGSYAGGMGMGMATDAAAKTTGRALLGAIVSTPGMPHFFKLTGPAASVLAARAELDALLASLTPRR